MTDTTTNLYHSIANPRRTTLMSVSAADAAAPHRETAPTLTLVGADDAAVCVDGVCALPE
ncbi:hypothetical protein [Cellulosimicrobium sp. NPDC055967]|uniref:hypothetical protein n=1 Tax=Cellulosimicrobium sp. NPDC055967 TaxID=3345670 RepID=UPI0035DEADA3